MKLLNFDEAIKLDHKIAKNYYKNYVNKGLAIAFKILGYDQLNIKRAYGCNLYLEDGTVILDMTAGIGVLALGHNHEKIIEVEQKFHRLKIPDSVKFGPNKLQAALAYNLSALLPGDLSVTFFSVSGAEANESAIKLVTMAQPKEKKYFISVKNSYHGKTHGTLSFTNTENFSEGFHIGINKDNLIKINYNDIDAYENTIKNIGSNKIAAIIVEPLQGQDINLPDKNYLSQICKISNKNNILTIFDEVKCGLGRTGNVFEFLNHDCIPDIVTTSKALGGGKNAISAMISSKKIFLKAYGPIKKSALHTTTFFGLGEGCATAIETLNIITDKKFIDKININSKFFISELKKIQTKYPKQIKRIKGKGLFLGIEFNFDNIVLDQLINFNIPIISDFRAILMGCIIREYLSKYKILTHFNNSSPNLLVILPPLIIEKNQIQYFIESTTKIMETGITKLFSKFLIANLKNNLTSE